MPGHFGSASFVAHPSGAAGAGCQAHSDGLQHHPSPERSGSAGVVTPSPDLRSAGGEQASPQHSSSWAAKGLEILPLLLAMGWICGSGVMVRVVMAKSWRRRKNTNAVHSSSQGHGKMQLQFTAAWTEHRHHMLHCHPTAPFQRDRAYWFSRFPVFAVPWHFTLLMIMDFIALVK